MTRDRPTGHRQAQNKSSSNNNSGTTNNSSGQKQNTNSSQNRPKNINFKPFHLFSEGDSSLKEAIEFVETWNINRHRVCVVSIVSKDAIGESSKQHLVESILNNGEVNKRHRLRKQRAQFQTMTHSESLTSTKESQSSRDGDPLRGEFYENQVTGNVDFKSGVVVLNLTSFMESDQLNALINDIEQEPLDWDVRYNSIVSKNWPRWNQNLVKSLLVLIILSHVIVFYSPEPSIDFGLLRLLRVLDSLRSRSQPRITDLLETMASKQVFPQQWIRQARVACPRALFLCDTSYLDIPICQADILATKRDLEDQIYLILKRLNLICRNQNCSASQPALMSLSDREEFVFLLTRNDRGAARYTSSDPQKSQTKTDIQLDDFYAKLFKDLKVDDAPADSPKHRTLESHQVTPNINSRSSAGSLDSDDSGKPLDSLVSSQEPSPVSLYSESPTTILPVHQSKFKKFIYRHITEIQQASQEAQDNNKQHSGAKTQPSVLLPRYDDFFAVLLRVKQLLFPNIYDNGTSKSPSPSSPLLPVADDQLEQQQQVIRNMSCNWPVIDERRFVDIYDNFDSDNLFSQRLCQNARVAAFKRFVSECDASHIVENCIPNSVPNAITAYDVLSRGPAKAENRQLLMAQFKDHLDSLYQNPQYKSKSNPATNSKQPKTGEPVVQEKQTSKTSNVTILRRGNGIKMLTSCECGKNSNFVIMPSDRKQKLERIDIMKAND